MALKKFSDVPYYLLKDYFDILSEINVDLPDSDIVSLYRDVIFEQDIFLDWDKGQSGFLDFEGLYDRVESKQSKSRLIGPKTTMITNGGSWTTLYAKIDDFGYKKIKLKPITDESWIDSDDPNWMKFDKADFDEYTPGVFDEDDISKESHLEEDPDITFEDIENSNTYAVVKRITNGSTELPDSSLASLPISASGKTFGFKTYKVNKLNEDITLSPEDEIYIRADSHFHTWFGEELKYLGDEIDNPNNTRVAAGDARFNEWNHKDFFNDNKLYSYLGPVWKIMNDDNRWQMKYRGMKDFAIEAIPENDMNANLKEMTWELFDRSHQAVYNSQKNVSSLIDFEEIQDEFLGYLAKYYGSDLDKYLLDTATQREYVKQLVYFLKKKGTYKSLYVMWKTLIRNNKNKITVYERWHDKYKREHIQELDLYNLEEK